MLNRPNGKAHRLRKFERSRQPVRVCVQRSFHECWHRCSVREQWRAAASGSAGGIAVMVGASGSQWCSRLGAHTGGRDGKVHRHRRCRQHPGQAQQPRSRRRPGPGVRKWWVQDPTAAAQQRCRVHGFCRGIRRSEWTRVCGNWRSRHAGLWIIGFKHWVKCRGYCGRRHAQCW